MCKIVKIVFGRIESLFFLSLCVARHRNHCSSKQTFNQDEVNLTQVLIINMYVRTLKQGDVLAKAFQASITYISFLKKLYWMRTRMFAPR
jgi:hypothetical protein